MTHCTLLMNCLSFCHQGGITRQLGPERTELLPNNDQLLLNTEKTVIRGCRNPWNGQKMDGLVLAEVSIFRCYIDNNVIQILVCKLQEVQEVLPL